MSMKLMFAYNLLYSDKAILSIAPKPSFYLHLLKDNALGVGSTGERLLILTTQITLLVILVCPALFTAMKPELTPGTHTTGLT